MYRAVTYHMLRQNITPANSEAVAQELSRLDLRVVFNGDKQRVILNGQDVNQEIRTPAVNESVSQVSAIPAVRRMLVKIQRQSAENQNVVLEGRDIGTVVFPAAELKFFMIADVRIRAQRRQHELEARGIYQNLETIEQDLIERDKVDSSRSLSPLKPATDAIELDTSKMTIDDQVAVIVNQAKQLNAKEEGPLMAEEEKKDIDRKSVV